MLAMKTNSLLLVSFALGLCQPLLAKEDGPETFTLVTTAGKKYEEARVVGVDADGVRIMHRDGAGKVAFADLSEEQRKKYGFDPHKASAFQQQQAEASQTATVLRARVATAAAEEQETTAFNTFRSRTLAAINSLEYDYAELDGALLKWIKIYTENDKKDWADVLQGDRKLLHERELMRPQLEAKQRTLALEAQNARLQQQIDRLNTSVRNTQASLDSVHRAECTTRTYSIYNNPFPISYYYRQPIYIQTGPQVCPQPQTYGYSSAPTPPSRPSFQQPTQVRPTTVIPQTSTVPQRRYSNAAN
jgi:hypothetical protein